MFSSLTRGFFLAPSISPLPAITVEMDNGNAKISSSLDFVLIFQSEMTHFPSSCLNHKEWHCTTVGSREFSAALVPLRRLFLRVQLAAGAGVHSGEPGEHPVVGGRRRPPSVPGPARRHRAGSRPEPHREGPAAAPGRRPGPGRQVSIERDPPA